SPGGATRAGTRKRGRRRPHKVGWKAPADVCLRSRHFHELEHRLLTPGPLHRWLDPAAIAEALESYRAGRRPIGLQIWRWLSLESWARQYLAADPRVIDRPMPEDAHPA